MAPTFAPAMHVPPLVTATPLAATTPLAAAVPLASAPPAADEGSQPAPASGALLSPQLPKLGE